MQRYNFFLKTNGFEGKNRYDKGPPLQNEAFVDIGLLK